MKIRSSLWLLPWLLLASPAMAAESNEIKALKTQINLLMQRVKALESKQQSSTSSASVEAKNTSAPSIATTAENTGNPSISVVGTFAGAAMHGGASNHSNSFLPLSEGEFVFGADVDAHTRLDITATAANGAMAIEEGYVTAYLPKGIRMRAGRKFIPLGRANTIHPHALVYADVPNGLVNLFGPEKLIGEGVFVDLPLYIGESAQSILFGFFQNANPVAFDPTGHNRFGGMTHWTGMWDMNDTSTLELGSTYVRARSLSDFPPAPMLI